MNFLGISRLVGKEKDGQKRRKILREEMMKEGREEMRKQREDQRRKERKAG